MEPQELTFVSRIKPMIDQTNDGIDVRQNISSQKLQYGGGYDHAR